MIRLAALALAASVTVPRGARAQCPNGAPPPCAAQQGRRLPPLDPHRIVVLPFRVTTADSLFGEGVAELLAPEFTGEGSPRAVDMASAINAWRRMGGGLRTPLALEAAMRVARELGAGLLCQGSIVGIGGRLTITASLLDVATGQPRGGTARAAGAADSIDALLRQVATSLLAASGVPGRAADATRLTTTPEALRAYVNGLSLWRRGYWNEAAQSFDASIAADSTFAAAVFQRWLYAAMTVGPGQWASRALEIRHRMTARERAIVEATAGTGVPRTRMQILADRRRVAQQLVDSPEAWYFFGDYVFHQGQSVVEIDSVIPIARMAFERAVALDSVPSFLGHLAEIALATNDTTLLRQLWSSNERLGAFGQWGRTWAAAGILRDTALLARARRSDPTPEAGGQLFDATQWLTTAVISRMPLAWLDEAFRRLDDVADPPGKEVVHFTRTVSHVIHGQRSAADIHAVRSELLFRRASATTLFSWFWVTGDAETDALFLDGRGAMADSLEEHRHRCVRAYVDIDRGQANRVNPDSLGPPSARCRRLIEGWLAFARGALSDSMVAAVDTLVTTATFQTFIGFEHRLLARMYESRGDTLRALRAIRLYPHDFAAAHIASTLREEGRYFVMARDTAAALRAYSRYLELRADATPPYAAERDSVRAIVNRLRRR